MTKISLPPTKDCTTVNVGDEEKAMTESVTTKSEEKERPDWGFGNLGCCGIFVLGFSVFILSPFCWVASLNALTSNIVECDQGNWSLWEVCVFEKTDKPAPFPEFMRYCEDLQSPAGFIHMARAGLIFFIILRVTEIFSFFIFSYWKSMAARLIKVLLEVLTSMFIAVAMNIFRDSYSGFLDNKLTGCHITSNRWIQDWPYICLPSQYVISVGWLVYMRCQLTGEIVIKRDCSDCNSVNKPTAKNSKNIHVIPHAVCAEREKRNSVISLAYHSARF